MPGTRKKSKSAPSSQETTPKVRLAGIFTRSISFSELAEPGEGKETASQDAEPGRADLNLRIGLTHGNFGADKGAEVVLDVTIRPDPSKQPYVLRIVMSAVFVVPSSCDGDVLDAFCRQSAPSILWPYLRALASSVSADGRYGPIRLDPVNLADFLRKNQWRQAAQS